MAGQKRLRGDDTDSFGSDCELGDEEFFYGRNGVAAHGFSQNNTVVKLNKQEEEDLIRELEN